MDSTYEAGEAEPATELVSEITPTTKPQCPNCRFEISYCPNCGAPLGESEPEI